MPLQAPRPRPAGSGALRRWELPYADAKPPLSSPRSTLLQRSRIAQGPPPQAPPGQANNAILKSIDTALVLGRESYGDAPISSRGISLPSVERDRFYGSTGGPQVEQELQRLGTLVKGLLRDFAVIKDTVFHIEDDKCSLLERMDHLEHSDVGILSNGLAETSKRLEDLIGTVDNIQPRVNIGEAAKDSSDTLACRIELLDARLMSLETGGGRPITASMGHASRDDVSCQDVCDDAIGSAVSLACITPVNDGPGYLFDNSEGDAITSAADDSTRVPPGSRLLTNGSVQSSGHSTPSSASFGNHFTEPRTSSQMAAAPFTPVPEERSPVPGTPPASSDISSGRKL